MTILTNNLSIGDSLFEEISDEKSASITGGVAPRYALEVYRNANFNDLLGRTRVGKC